MRVHYLTPIAIALVLGMFICPAPAAGIFVNTGALNTARQNHQAVLLHNGQVLIVGGSGGNGNYLASAELYHPSSGTWTNTGPLQIGRTAHTATLLTNGLVLVAGGAGSAFSWVSSCEIYEPTSGTWTNSGPLKTARTGHTATLLSNGKVLVSGGYSIDTFSRLSSAELYDPATGKWSEVAPMSTNRMNHTATALTDGTALVAGGYRLSSTEFFDSNTGTWSPAPSLTTNREYSAAVLLQNGRIMVTGGGFGLGTPLDPNVRLRSAEEYVPSGNAWASLDPMSIARAHHSITLLPNGTVLVVGGDDTSYAPLASADLYDPSTENWTLIALNTNRLAHTATVLKNGQVLVAGGKTLNGLLLSNTELYVEEMPVNLIAARSPNGAFQIGFSNAPNRGFSVLTATNPLLAISNWSVLGPAAETAPGHYQFTDQEATNTNNSKRFYRVKSD